MVAALLLWAEGPPARIHFVDVARQAGVVAEMRSGDPAHHWIPEANGTGVAWLDYDGDGWFDLLLVGGADMDVFRAVKRGETPPPRTGGVYLYRNLGNGKFEDVTERAGLTNPYWGTGANAIDYDNDGHTDILITTIGRDLLFHNNGNGTFTEKGSAAGLTRQMHWHTGSAFGDYDGDGFPDLYIAGYVALDALEFSGKPPVCLYRGVPGFCGPMSLKGEADILYHNNGDGTFTDVTAKAGVVDKGLYHGFTVVFHDFNGDGRPDIFVANDSNPNYLYVNQGDGTFREAALVSGVGFNEDGQTMANMGVALGDYDNDGLIDFLTTVFSEDHFPLFRQVKAGLYEEVSASTGLAAVTSPWVGWSCGFADLDNDGDRDLWMANGHVYPNAGMLPTTAYLQPFVVMENRGGKFVRVNDPVDAPRAVSHRGGAAGDFNNDGKVDVAVVPVEGTPLLLKNDSSGMGQWIGFHLMGGARHRDALGASIRIEGCGRMQTAAVFNGGSYLSRNDPRVHFGLGACEVVDRAVVRWPGGKVQTVEHPALNRYHSVVEHQ
jgi:hypothetical protein